MEFTHVAIPPEGAVQTFPQPPQFRGSVVVSLQEPLQFVRPLAQLPVHLPPEHTRLPHEIAQSPQCAESDDRSTHVPLQFV